MRDVSGPNLEVDHVQYGQAPAAIKTLTVDTNELSETGGAVNYLLKAGSDNSGRSYILLGSISGTNPGTPLPGGHATLPLNWDFLTGLVVELINTAVFKDFMGVLDVNGTSTAQLNMGPVPGAAGLTMYYAYALNGPWNFASTPVAIDIIP